MRFRLIVEEDKQTLIVRPETIEEARFLGVLVPEPLDSKCISVAHVNTFYESHFSDKKVSSMEFVFTGRMPPTAHT